MRLVTNVKDFLAYTIFLVLTGEKKLLESPRRQVSMMMILPLSVQYSSVQLGTVVYSTVQYSSVQSSTVQYSSVQLGTVVYSTVQ